MKCQQSAKAQLKTAIKEESKRKSGVTERFHSPVTL